MSEVERRLEAAEGAVAHLERQYDALNAAVIEQGRLIERMRKQLERLSESLDAQEMERIRSTNAKPPHYSV